MDYSLKVRKKIEIEANISDIWRMLTSNEKLSDVLKMSVKCKSWKKGETISFSGLKNNLKFTDKAIITEFHLNERLTYTYYKSGSDDYTELSFLIKQKGKDTSELILNGKGFLDSNDKAHSENAWKEMLKIFKNGIEEK
ncbi:SRPBCC domain-containing protein [Lacinutrix salivirga]